MGPQVANWAAFSLLSGNRPFPSSLCLCFKTRQSAKPFICKSVLRTRPFKCKSTSFSYETFCTWTHFETEVENNSEMAYSILCCFAASVHDLNPLSLISLCTVLLHVFCTCKLKIYLFIYFYLLHKTKYNIYTGFLFCALLNKVSTK